MLWKKFLCAMILLSLVTCCVNFNPIFPTETGYNSYNNYPATIENELEEWNSLNSGMDWRWRPIHNYVNYGFRYPSTTFPTIPALNIRRTDQIPNKKLSKTYVPTEKIYKTRKMAIRRKEKQKKKNLSLAPKVKDHNLNLKPSQPQLEAESAKTEIKIDNHKDLMEIMHNHNHAEMEIKHNSEEDADDKSKEEDEEDCDGFDNFLDDIGLMNYALSIVLSFIGISSLIPSILTQIYSYFSVYGIAVPSTLLLFLGYVPESVQTFFDAFSVFDTIVNIIILLPIGDQLNYLSIALEAIGIGSLLVDTFGAYPELTESYLKIYFNIDVDKVFEGYGCPRR